MPAYDALNTHMAPSKSVFDSQQLHRPAAYRHCGRASLCIGIVCIMAEVGVFVLKRGLTTLGIGIWTGATFVMFGAASMAVPRTRSVCSVNTCFVMALGSMAISVLGILTCIVHTLMLSSIMDSSYTPRPNFELSCEFCGYVIIMKEVGQVVLLLAQFLVSLALLYFAYRDCLCCHSTETEVVMGPVKVVTTVPASCSASSGNHQQLVGGAGAGVGGPPGAAGASGVGAVCPPSGSIRGGASGPMLYEL